MVTPKPKKILAMKLRALGDTVLMTAALAEIKRAWPLAELHVAVTSTWAPLIENHPAVTQIWKYERFEDRGARAKSVMRLALKLRRERFDCVINFHASPSSATIAFATGAALRSVHFHGHKDRNRHSTVLIPGKGIVKPIIERDMDAVRALNPGIEIPSGLVPSMSVSDSERKRAHDRWLGPPSRAGRRLLVIGLGASRPSKTWPMERFAGLAMKWASAGGSVLAAAGSSETEELSDFLKVVDGMLARSSVAPETRQELKARIDGESRLSLRELAAALSVASVFAGNDSGPKHIAVAVGCPTVTLFGPEDPFEWHPYDRKLHPYLFIEPLACRKDAAPGMPPWCGVHLCIEEQHRCMRLIEVDSVLSECKRVARELTGYLNGESK